MSAVKPVPNKDIRQRLYRRDSAAKELGVGLRQLSRLTQQIHKDRVRMGSNRVHLYTESELQSMRELQKKSA